MLKKYLIAFLVSMVPLIELRGGVPYAVVHGLDYFPALIICAIGNMLPVPIIYFFARKVLEWGRDKKYIGKFCKKDIKIRFLLAHGKRKRYTNL